MADKIGTSGADMLYGGGPDTLVGLEGDDTFVVYTPADVVVERRDQGRDTVLTFSNFDANGQSIEVISTAINAGTDPIALTGSVAFAQLIVGNYGNNVINGLGGGDTMIGLRGDDTYSVYGPGDIVVENAGEGFDTVLSRASYTLGAGVSVERLADPDPTSFGNTILGGNELTQSIVGNAGNNLLSSGGGADTLSGGNGNDTYRLFGTGETVTEALGAGNDAIYSSGSFALTAGSSVELISTVVHAETAAINLAGNALSQTIIGNYGANILNGGGSGGTGDTLIGLVGDDVYRVYTSADIVTENAGEGADLVYTSGNYTLRQSASIEALSTADNAATAAINLTGNEIANTVVGNFGVNLIDGGAGNDLLYGLAGADVFRFSTALGSGNVDTIADFGNGADVVLLDPTIFTGLPSGTLAASAIAYGAAAADADDRIVYNPQTGALSFDADGNGAGAAIQFATLSTGLAASVIQVNVAASGPAGDTTVRINTGGTYSIGGATLGTSLEGTYPAATTFIFGTTTASQPTLPHTIAFGPNSYADGHPTISATDGNAFGGFDFSQLGTGLVVNPGGDFLTAGGASIISFPTSIGVFYSQPATITGTPFDDVINRSDAIQNDGFGQPPFGTINGGAGNDTIIGGRYQNGGDGDDRLVGKILTVMTGGAGVDTFDLPINARTPGTNSGSSPNVLVDYDSATDRIELVLNISSDLTPGALDASRFISSNSGATTVDQRIIYNPDTGVLRYDFNGSIGDPSSSAGLLGDFAKLPLHLDLTAANFVVIGA